MNPPLAPWLETAWQTLAQRAAHGTLPHALLLAGAQGLGKCEFAEAFVRARLCERLQSGAACGSCRTCALLDAGTHPDRIRVTLEVNEKTGKLRSEIIVEQIRALSARLAMATQFGGWQVAVIDPADAMNAAAANALLKTLEEPTASSLIVLIADQPWRLPATVRSRCQRVDFAAPAHDDALAWLHAQDVADAAEALRIAGGSPGRAAQLAREGGLPRCESVGTDLRALAAAKTSAQAVAKAWAADEPDARLEHAARWFLDAARHRTTGSEDATAARWDMRTLQSGFAGANRVREQLRGPLRPEIALLDFFYGLNGRAT